MHVQDAETQHIYVHFSTSPRKWKVALMAVVWVAPGFRYFDMKGIAEPIRLAFTIGGIKFEDHRIKREDWAELKPKTPYGGLPLLEVDGKTYAQADAILKTAGRLTNLYPKGLLDQLKVDEYLGAAQDILSAIQPSLRESDDKKKAEMRKVTPWSMLTEIQTLFLAVWGEGTKHM